MIFCTFSLQNVDFHHKSRPFGHEHVGAQSEVFLNGKFVHKVDPINRDRHKGVRSSMWVKIVRVVVLKQIFVTAVTSKGVQFFDYAPKSYLFSIYCGVALP